MKERNLNVIGICEAGENEEQRVLHDGYILIYKGYDAGRHGASIVLSPMLVKRVDSTVYKNERNIAVTSKMRPWMWHKLMHLSK